MTDPIPAKPKHPGISSDHVADFLNAMENVAPRLVGEQHQLVSEAIKQFMKMDPKLVKTFTGDDIQEFARHIAGDVLKAHGMNPNDWLRQPDGTPQAAAPNTGGITTTPLAPPQTQPQAYAPVAAAPAVGVGVGVGIGVGLYAGHRAPLRQHLFAGPAEIVVGAGPVEVVLEGRQGGPHHRGGFNPFFHHFRH